jgi:hypothetical protein
MARRDYVIIDHVESGQPRPYADAVFSAYISLRREGVLLNNQKFYVQLTEEKVKDLARLCAGSTTSRRIGPVRDWLNIRTLDQVRRWRKKSGREHGHRERRRAGLYGSWNLTRTDAPMPTG